MSDVLKSIRTTPAPLPPAAGQFGYRPHGSAVELNAFRPNGCPSPDQFEAHFLAAEQTVRSTKPGGSAEQR